MPVQRGRHEHPPLLVELGVGGGREEEPLQLSRLLGKGVQRREPGLHQRIPIGSGEHVEALVEAAGEHDSAGQRLAETGRKREPVLVVDGVFVFAEEHVRTRSWLSHFAPL